MLHPTLMMRIVSIRIRRISSCTCSTPAALEGYVKGDWPSCHIDMVIVRTGRNPVAEVQTLPVCQSVLLNYFPQKSQQQQRACTACGMCRNDPLSSSTEKKRQKHKAEMLLMTS